MAQEHQPNLPHRGKIYLVAPSWGIECPYLEPEPAQEYLDRFGKMVANEWGYECIRPQGDVCGHTYLNGWAGTPELRVAQLEEALRADNVVAIFAISGGGGSKELILLLQKIHEKNPFPKSNKPFIGISDATSIGLYLESIGAVTHVQGPGIFGLQAPIHIKNFDFARLERNKTAFRSLLDHPDKDIEFELIPANKAAQKLTTDGVRGIIVGGCSGNVELSCGTPAEPKWDRRILYMEGFSWPIIFNKQKWERGRSGPGEIPDILRRLQTAVHILDKLSAIVVGDIYGGYFPEELKKENIQALEDFASRLEIPVFKGVKQGHNPEADCFPIPMGTRCTITQKGLLKVASRRSLEQDVEQETKSTDCYQNPVVAMPLEPRHGTLGLYNPNKPSIITAPPIINVIANSLIHYNSAAKRCPFPLGEIVGYGKVGNSYLDSLYRTDFLKGYGVSCNLMIGGIDGYQYSITDMLLRGQLGKVKSIILVNTQMPEGEFAKGLMEYLDRHFTNVPVYFYQYEKELPNKFTGTLLTRSQESEIEQRSVSHLPRDRRQTLQNILERGVGGSKACHFHL